MGGHPSALSALPRAIDIICSTEIDFEENQLYPILVCLSPLATSHYFTLCVCVREYRVRNRDDIFFVIYLMCDNFGYSFYFKSKDTELNLPRKKYT
jgi:hypothetical protein